MEQYNELGRICTKCGVFKEWTLFGKRQNRPIGRKSRCKECEAESSRRYREENPEKVKETRRQYSEENPEKARECERRWKKENAEKVRESHRRWKAKNREKVRENDRRWKAKNPEKVKEKDRRYYEENAEKKKEQARRWYEENTEKAAQNRCRWSKDNPEKRAESDRSRRARKRGVFSDLTLTQWETIVKIYGHRCAYCNEKKKKLTQDHVIPLSKGGLHTASNIVPACRSCNSRKGARKPHVPVQMHLVLSEK